MPKGKELIPLDQALDKMLGLFDRWGLKAKDWVMVDEFAYRLQGYDVSGPEVEEGHIDVYLNPTACPWPVKAERSIIPPLAGGFTDQWISFMEQTGYGLDLLRAKPEFLSLPRKTFQLSDGKLVQLMRAKEMTTLFVEQTIMHYGLQEVDEQKIKQWINKLLVIRDAALKRGDAPLAKFCQDKFEESKIKWKSLNF